jgi:hypothetical protein
MSKVLRYSINDFENIINNGISFKLPDSTINIISNIAEQVGVTEYIKQPIFPKKNVSINNSNHLQNDYYFNKNKKFKNFNRNNELIDDDWDNLRTFVPTEIKKKEGIQNSIDQIRMHMNKLTDKTYELIIIKIYDEINKLNNDNNKNIEDYSKIGECIFNIASGNSFYSNMYAKLYKDLMTKYSFMKEIFDNHFNSFSELFTNIEYCNPNINYDKFCEINKVNEKRRALCLFYVNLMKENIIDNDKIVEIIINIQDFILKKIKEENKKEIVDELSETIHIFVTKSSSILDTHEKWDDILYNIEIISKMKLNNYPSITNKCIFKHMDILDEL